MDNVTAPASAPGKLFLFGEYGVLTGGLCLVAAVDRRVHAHRRRDADGYEVVGADFGGSTALPEAVLAQLGSSALDRCPIEQLSADVGELYDATTGEKLGLGSSAASAVALAALCSPENAPSEAVFRHAFDAHRRLQGGRGSGADIASSTFGGVIAYRLAKPVPPFSRCAPGVEIAADVVTEHAQVQTGLAVPSGLRVEALWLGSPARSTSFVRRCEAAIAESPADTTRALCETSAIAEEALQALAAEDADRVVACAHQADEALTELGELIGAPIITDKHRALRRPAHAAGLAVKPSGAGGGDFSLAFGPADASWESFLQELPAGVRHIRVMLGAAGVRRETSR